MHCWAYRPAAHDLPNHFQPPRPPSIGTTQRHLRSAWRAQMHMLLVMRACTAASRAVASDGVRICYRFALVLRLLLLH